MDDPLANYLHDHLAESSFAVELLQKLAAEFAGTPSGTDEGLPCRKEEVVVDYKPGRRVFAGRVSVKTGRFDLPPKMATEASSESRSDRRVVHFLPSTRCRVGIDLSHGR